VTTQRQLDPGALGNHIDSLYRAAWSVCGSREDANDLVQETFLQVLRRPRFPCSDEALACLL
jgi:RNA polymerase sigma-70 factor, ECF subfamily